MFLIMLFLLIALNYTNSSPIQPLKDKKMLDEHDIQTEYDAIYVPYDIKYVTLEIEAQEENFVGKNSLKHAFIQDSKNSESTDGEFKNIDKNIDETEEYIKTKDLVLVPLSALSDKGDKDSLEIYTNNQNHKDLLAVPLSTLTKQDTDKFDVTISNDEFKTILGDLILVPVIKSREDNESVENDSSKDDSLDKNIFLVPISSLTRHRVSEESTVENHQHKFKRQAPGLGFAVVRPVVRLRRISRRPALVGYLTDYDDFPTVL